MVILAAGIFNSKGKHIFVRAFVELSKSRIESLANSFAKLCLDATKDCQHTYVETDSVRYLFLPVEDLYMVVITSRVSDIIEDMEVNRLLVSLITKICDTVEEKTVYEQRFNLINAFDEVISFKGRKEKVNLEQIKSFVEMESHDEKVHELEVAEKQRKAYEIRKQKEQEIKQNMQRKAMMSSNMSSMGSMGFSGNAGFAPTYSQPAMEQKSVSVQQTPQRKGLVLGKKVESAFMEKIAKEDKALTEKLRSESQRQEQEQMQEQQSQGQENEESASADFAPPSPTHPRVQHKPVHVSIKENFSVVVDNEGTVKSYDVTGELSLNIASVDFSGVALDITEQKPGFQIKTHPKVDKGRFHAHTVSSVSGAFPAGGDLALLRWRGDMKTEKDVPVSVSCWSSSTSEGLSLTISCESQHPENLYDIGIAIPTPVAPKTISTENGDAEYDENGGIVWSIPELDANGATLDVLIPVDGSDASSCFPILVDFGSRKSLCGIEVVAAKVEGAPVEFSQENVLTVTKFAVDME